MQIFGLSIFHVAILAGISEAKTQNQPTKEKFKKPGQPS